MLHTLEKVSLKITYEFSTFAADQLVELVNYEETLTTVGSFNIIDHPQLTVFESTSTYYLTALHPGLHLNQLKLCYNYM